MERNMSSLKVITLNVNSITVRVERLLGLLKAYRPDIVCLQELKVEEAKFPFEVFRENGYSAHVFGQKTYNGVAVMALGNPRPVARGFVDDVDDPAARFIGLKFDERV